MNGVYRRYRLELFPKLLKDPSVSSEDKRKYTGIIEKALESGTYVVMWD